MNGRNDERIDKLVNEVANLSAKLDALEKTATKNEVAINESKTTWEYVVTAFKLALKLITLALALKGGSDLTGS